MSLLSKNWSYTLAALVPLVVSIALGVIFRPGSWFCCLRRSRLTPPGWVFAIVWTILYPLIGCAMVTACYGEASWTWALPVVNIVVSLAFSPVMFGAHMVREAMFITVACLAMGIGLIIQYSVANHSSLAAGLMVPYVVWLVLASYLAWYIWRNNDCRILYLCERRRNKKSRY